MTDLSDWIRHHAELTATKPAILFEGAAISYADLADQIDCYALVLKNALGIKPGDRIGYLGFNSPVLIKLLFACARVGAVLLPLNWRLAPAEHVQLLQHAQPRALFVTEDFVAQVNTVRAQIGLVTLVCQGAEEPGWSGWKQLEIQSLQQAAGDWPVGLSEDDGVLLCYTSGTTGAPKGALLSKKALYWNALNSIDMHAMTAADTILTVLPMFHVGGLDIQTLPALFAGATVVIQRQFDTECFYQAIAEYAVTLTLIVPTVLLALMADARWSRGKPSSLRLISIGSTIVPASMVSAVCEWGVPMVQVYGSTETAPIAAYTPPADAARKPASTGKTAKHCEIKIVDGTGAELATGQSGEILVRGPNVMLEYWQDEKATNDVFSTDRWLHTGDIGHFDDEGFLYVDDRLKDVIISGGENIYPAQVESVLLTCPAIEEVAVVGRPDDYWGEVAVAVVVEKTGCAVDAGLIMNFCNGRIARFSCPREVLVVECLPRNVMGKIVKQEVRQWVINNTV